MAVQVFVGVSKAGISVRPEKAIATVRDAVEWLVFVEKGMPPLRVTVYFRHGMAFTWETKSIEFDKQQDFDRPASIADVPQKPGDYKYGVRAEDLKTTKTLADDDPYLYILP